MREILFRGKRVDNGEWVYGYLHQDTISSSNGTYLALVISEHTDVLFGGVWYEVIPETVGQYTGLTDKNDTKIFDGDIVTAPYLDPIFSSPWNKGNPTENTVVKYDNGMFYIEYIESKRKITLFGLLDGEKEAKIIGNIHDNPALIESEVKTE